MMEFIQQVTKQLGINESASRSLTGGLLGLIQQNANAGDFSQLLSKLPGAQQLIGQATAAQPAGGTGGLAGGLLGKVGAAIGGQAGGALGLAEMFRESGVSAEQGKSFVGLFVNFLQSKAGAELVTKLLGQVPALKSFLG